MVLCCIEEKPLRVEIFLLIFKSTHKKYDLSSMLYYNFMFDSNHNSLSPSLSLSLSLSDKYISLHLLFSEMEYFLFPLFLMKVISFVYLTILRYLLFWIEHICLTVLWWKLFWYFTYFCISSMEYIQRNKTCVYSAKNNILFWPSMKFIVPKQIYTHYKFTLCEFKSIVNKTIYVIDFRNVVTFPMCNGSDSQTIFSSYNNFWRHV